MVLPRTFTFTGANGTDLVTYDAAFSYSGGGLNSMGITSNTIQGIGASVENLAVVSGETFNTDHYAEAKVTQVGSRNKGVCGRMDGSGNGYAFYGKGPSSYGNRYLVIEVLRTPTTLSSDSSPMLINKLIRLECVGSAQTCKHDGVTVLTGSDATYSSGKPGLAFPSQSTAATLDDLVVDDLGAAPSGQPTMRRFGGFKHMSKAIVQGLKVW